MSEPKLSPGSGGIRHIPNPVQRRKELGVTDREQTYDETPVAIPGLGVLEPGPSARVLKRRAFRAWMKKKKKR